MYDEGMCPRAVSSLIGASLVAAVMSTFFKSQLSTVHRVFRLFGQKDAVCVRRINERVQEQEE